MRKRFLLSATLVTAAASMSAPRTAAAQMSGDRTIRIGVDGGLTVPVSDARHAFDNGVAGGAFVLVRLGALPALRFDLQYQKLEFKNQLAGAVAGRSQVLGGVAGIKLDLLRGPVRPYVLAGAGAFNVRSEVEAAGGASTDASATRFGVDGGAGISFRLGRLDAFVEGRVQNVYTDRGVIDTRSIRTVPVTFGILF